MSNQRHQTLMLCTKLRSCWTKCLLINISTSCSTINRFSSIIPLRHVKANGFMHIAQSKIQHIKFGIKEYYRINLTSKIFKWWNFKHIWYKIVWHKLTGINLILLIRFSSIQWANRLNSIFVEFRCLLSRKTFIDVSEFWLVSKELKWCLV